MTFTIQNTTNEMHRKLMMAMIRSPIGNTPTVHAGEVQPADDERDERVDDDVVDERGDDGRERAADYDADGQVNDVAARDEMP